MQLISKLLNLFGLKILKRSTYESLELSKDTISTLLLINSKLSDRIRELDGFIKQNNIYKNIDLIMLSLSNFSEIDLCILDSEKKVNFDTEYLVKKYEANIINFDSLDNIPVDIVVLLFFPANKKSEYLQILASISRLLRNSDLTNKLRGCKNQESAFATFSQIIEYKAA